MLSDHMLCGETVVFWGFFSPQKKNAESSKKSSEKCEGSTSHSVPHYHLMCLLAHAFNVTTPGICHRNNADIHLSVVKCFHCVQSISWILKVKSSDCKIQSAFSFFSLSLLPCSLWIRWVLVLVRTQRLAALQLHIGHLCYWKANC